MIEDGFEEVLNLVIFDRKIRVESPEEKRQHFYILYEIKTGGLKSKVNILNTTRKDLQNGSASTRFCTNVGFLEPARYKMYKYCTKAIISLNSFTALNLH